MYDIIISHHCACSTDDFWSFATILHERYLFFLLLLLLSLCHLLHLQGLLLVKLLAFLVLLYLFHVLVSGGHHVLILLVLGHSLSLALCLSLAFFRTLLVESSVQLYTVISWSKWYLLLLLRSQTHSSDSK